jgi:hypothetical protein
LMLCKIQITTSKTSYQKELGRAGSKVVRAMQEAHRNGQLEV